MGELWRKAKELGLHLLSVALDLAYLVLWVYANAFADEWIARKHLGGIGRVEELSFDVIFAVGSVLPVLFWIYRDIRIMGIRTKRAIEEERRR